MAFNLSLENAFRAGWRATTQRPGLWLSYYGLVIALSVVDILLGKLVDANSVHFFLTITFRLAQWFLTFGAIGISLRLLRGQNPQVAELFRPNATFWSYVASTILYGIIIIVGLVFLIVPGIMLGLMFGFYGYATVDRNLGPIEALKASAALTRGHKVDLFLFACLTILLNLVGVLCLFVGLFVTLVITHFALADLYRQLADAPAAQA